MAHLWLMQAVKEELKKNNGAFVISASVAGLRPGGSSMVSTIGSALGTPGPTHSSLEELSNAEVRTGVPHLLSSVSKTTLVDCRGTRYIENTPPR